MGDIPPSPSSFKSALSFFSSLDRSSPSPLIPRRSASNFEVNLKLVIDSKTVARTTYDVHQEKTYIRQQQLIPRARLTKKPEESGQRARRSCERDYCRESSGKVLLETEPPKVPPRPTVIKLQTNWGLAPTSNRSASEETPLLTTEPKELLTPDQEAKQILEAFNKEITPYNQFEVPVDALESEFFKETLSIANSSVDLSEVKPSSRVCSYISRSSISSYGLPDNKER